MWLDLQKPSQLAQELKSNLMNNIKDTFMHAPSRHLKCVAIDSQVCFHGQLFADPVKPSWCITGPLDPLERTNQNWLGAKLLPMAILIYSVVCVYPCHLLRAQHHCFWSNDKESPPSACPPTPTFTTPSPLYHPWYYRSCKKLSQKPAVNTTRQS